MKHYWINTDDCTLRREYMEKQLKHKNIDNIRITAETPETIKNYSILRHPESNETDLEISCLISHIKAIKQGYDNGDDYFCVLEDDMQIEKLNFDVIIEYIKLKEADDNTIIENLQLYTNSHPSIINIYNQNIMNCKMNFLIKRIESYPSAGYYLISRKGAEKIIKKFILENNKYDLSYLSWTVSDNYIYEPINTYILTYPIAISITDFGSTLHNSHIHFHILANNVIKNIWQINDIRHLLTN
jgi:GR25 family glycosyltransferase involved in LPS biosynthesis